MADGVSGGGQLRERLAAVSTVTGFVVPWDPNVNQNWANGEFVWVIALDGSTLYVTSDMYLLRIRLNVTGVGF